jgi:hypothetical protein
METTEKRMSRLTSAATISARSSKRKFALNK